MQQHSEPALAPLPLLKPVKIATNSDPAPIITVLSGPTPGSAPTAVLSGPTPGSAPTAVLPGPAPASAAALSITLPITSTQQPVLHQMPVKSQTTGSFHEQSEELYSPEVLEAARSGQLTGDMLEVMSFSELTRLAYMYQSAGQFIQRKYDLYPLPLNAKYELRVYQADVIEWMREKECFPHHGIRGGIVSLKMGLGKTLISLAHTLTSERGIFPSLVVANKTVMSEWKKQIKQFFGSRIKVLYLHKDYIGKNIDYVTRKQVMSCDLVVTTYDVCASACRKGAFDNDVKEMGDDHSLQKDKVVAIHCRSREHANLPNEVGKCIIYGTPWHRVICDESQRFANPKTATYRYMMAIYGQYKWCLTGTPIRNNMTDIWSQLRFCGYNVVTRSLEWKKNSNYYKVQKLEQNVFQMGYEEAGIKIPDKIEHKIVIQLEKRENTAYMLILGIAKHAYNLFLRNLIRMSSMLTLFIRLRQCVIAPYLMTPLSKRKKSNHMFIADNQDEQALIQKVDNMQDSLSSWMFTRDGTAGIHSSKITQVCQTIDQIPDNEKVIVFSSFTSCLDLVRHALLARDESMNVLQLDGDVVGEKRRIIIDSFQKYPDHNVLLISYGVGAEGLNLTMANHVIFIEPWWNPAVHDQCIARAWRSGQTKEVHVYQILVENSIEDRIMMICDEKRKLADVFLSGATGRKAETGLSKQMMGRLLDL